MSRILPGDLVSFKPFVRDMQDLPKVQVIRARVTKRKYKDAICNTGEEASRLAEVREELEAADPKHLYLVLTASQERAFLTRCGNGKYVVAFTKDLINHKDDEDS